MSILDNIIERLGAAIAKRVVDTSAPEVEQAIVSRGYRQGQQRRLLRVKGSQFDDNIVLNFYGLVLNRIVSQMLGGGFELDFEGEGETEQEQLVTATLDANKQEVLFHRAAQAAGEAGTGYLYLMPDAAFDRKGNKYTRIVVLDPAFVTMESAPEDFELVIRYIIRYKFTNVDGKEAVRRRVIEQNEGGETWVIKDYLQVGSGREELVATVEWPFSFAPVLHWQNKPSIDEAYGEPDIDGAGLALQDRLNFLASNMSKIVRLYAHPPRYSKGAGMAKTIDIGPDSVPDFPNDPTSGITQLEQLGDMAGAMQYNLYLRQAFFDSARVVDIDSIGDKLGALTNFALHVLYQDNINLIRTKRELFGDMLEELSMRLQVIAGVQPVECEVVWPEWLPENEVEKLAAMQGALNMGVVSKETLATELGYDWEEEQERMKGEQEASDNVGAAILRGFNRGGGGGLNIPMQQQQQRQQVQGEEQNGA